MYRLLRTSLFSLFLALQGLMQAQSYMPLAIENATWIMAGYGDYNLNAWAYKIQGDTTIQNIAYKKLYHFDLEVYLTPSNNKEFKLKSTKLLALLRDDIEDRKVFIRRLNPSVESLEFPYNCDSIYWNEDEIILYDFEKTIGDSIIDCRQPDRYETIHIDTTLFKYDFERRVLALSPDFNYPSYNIIEGVGYESGLFSYPAYIGHAGKGYDLWNYCVGSNYDCRITTSGEEVLDPNGIKIYPNPCQDILHFNSYEQINKLSIYSSKGRLLKALTNPRDRMSLDISNFDSGIYFIQIMNNRKGTFTYKFFKI